MVDFRYFYVYGFEHEGSIFFGSTEVAALGSVELRCFSKSGHGLFVTDLRGLGCALDGGCDHRF